MGRIQKNKNAIRGQSSEAPQGQEANHQPDLSHEASGARLRN